tara:strand:+ start:1959 stop:2504 length:546 start_codon:yes stop_codon:yes gene_type:complete
MNKDGRLCLCCNEFRAYLICGTCGEETKEREGVYFSDKDAAYFEAVDEEHERRVDWRRREWRERRERLDRDIQASAIDYKMEERRVCEDDLIKRWGRVLTFQEERKRIKIEADFNSRKGHDLSDYKSEKEWSPHRSLPIWDIQNLPERKRLEGGRSIGLDCVTSGARKDYWPHDWQTGSNY